MIRAPVAWALGGLLFVLPFARYGFEGFHRHPGGPHMDHVPRYGGLLGMAGDQHVELLRRNQRIFVFPSDAMRRPLDVEGVVAVAASGEEVKLRWRRDRWEAEDVLPGPEVTIRWWAAGEAPRTMEFVAPKHP